MNHYDEDQDPLFHIDALIGVILNVLATVGAFAAFVAACLLWGGV